MEEFQLQCQFEEQDVLEIEPHDADGMLTVSIKEGRITSSMCLDCTDATRLRDWLNQWLERQG